MSFQSDFDQCDMRTRLNILKLYKGARKDYPTLQVRDLRVASHTVVIKHLNRIKNA